METIIVTVTDEHGSFYQDMELPLDVPIARLKEEIVETLNVYFEKSGLWNRYMGGLQNGDKPELMLSAAQTAIGNPRYKWIFRDDETLEAAGFWNGDYLILYRM